jgi:nicotinate dehydrogenase subunit A
MARITKLNVTGSVRTMDVDEGVSLLSVLRDELDLTGSKYGCGEGQCGACTVWVDSLARRSCVLTVGMVRDKRVTTIEGLAKGDQLHPLQEAFLEEEAMQCAYCTSGMIMSGAALLKANANPSEADIVTFMEGNVCRCGTHPRIVAAIRRAAKALRSSRA